MSYFIKHPEPKRVERDTPKFINIRIKRREKPDAPQYWEEFELRYRPNLNIISCLMEIRKNPVTKDGTLTTPPVWDMNCLESVCGICTMIINGTVRQACSALIDNLEFPINLEPMTKFPNVRDLAVENPAATRVFEKFKMDYCCGGHVSFEEACQNAGVEMNQVSEMLKKAVNGSSANNMSDTDFTKMSLASLSDYIVRKHHDFTRDENERITALLEKVCSVHGGNHAELFDIQKNFGALRLELENHILK